MLALKEAAQKNKSTILNLARLNLNIGDIKKSEKYYNSLLNIEPDNLSYDYSLLRIDKKYLLVIIISISNLLVIIVMRVPYFQYDYSDWN